MRLGSEIYFQADMAAGIAHAGFMYAFATINFAHMAIFMFLFSVALCITVTLLTNPPDYARISGLSFGTLTAEDRHRPGTVTPCGYRVFGDPGRHRDRHPVVFHRLTCTA